MSKLHHYYGLNPLHYLTRSTYRRTRVYDCERFKNQWVATLGKLRQELEFRIVGYVLMPEHFHLLLWPGKDASPSLILQKLEDRTAIFVRSHASRQRTSGSRYAGRRPRIPISFGARDNFRVEKGGG